MAANRFVRSSKFRHVFGTPKKDQTYDNIRVTKSPNESPMCSVNCKFIAVVLEAQGGGAFLVAPVTAVGRFDINYPKVSGHKSNVMDIAWNPFNENQIASCSEDCTVKIWNIPDGGLKDNLTEADVDLVGHEKKVTALAWHPSAADVLASIGNDYVIIVWNTQSKEQLYRLQHPDQIQSMSWNYDGSQIATTCKDKKLRLYDARSSGDDEPIAVTKSHEGTKPSRVVCCGITKCLFTTGFSRMSERQVGLWGVVEEKGEMKITSLASLNIDTSSGVMFPTWDEGTKMVYLVGKGDTQLRYFEVTPQADIKLHFLSMYQPKDSSTARGAGVLPKKDVEYKKCEVMRFYRVLTPGNKNGGLEPVSMTVPRKSDMFQDDIFPPCPAGVPALTADEWASGVNKDPWLVRFTQNGLEEMTLDQSQISAKGGSVAPVKTGPTTLHEYKAEYKKLLAENEKLKARIAELEGKN